MSLRMRSAPARGSALALNVPPEFERAVIARVASGQYASAEEVFEMCLRLLEREEQEYEEKLAWLRRELAEADEESKRGEAIDGEEAFAAAREELRRRFGS